MKTTEELLQNGYDFQFSLYFSKGWKLLSKHLGIFIGMTLLFIIMGLIIGFIPLVNIIWSFISVVLYAGYYVFLSKSNNGLGEAKDFFGAFNFIGDIILYRLVLLAFFLPLILLVIFFGFPMSELIEAYISGMSSGGFTDIAIERPFSEGGLFSILMILIVVAGIYVYTSYLFVLPLIVVGKYKFWNAMETSRKVVGKHFFSFLFTGIAVSFLLGLITVISCGLGIFVAIPLGMCIVYAAFNEIFKPSEDNKSMLDDFGSSLGDVNTESGLDS